ncbi:MAG: GUN4 domain-containing protein [Hormoscilla sp. SP5CHS1]|nr:GUN4 domain-containing protein [Hormoscilla sp. SP5CHS1]MBC6475329.1 GUN4 domain-containing protein [Hormoscilla sp. GM102CHS1]
MAERVGWQRGGRWHTWENLTFGLAAPTGHLPGVPALGSFRGGVRR